jgi:hypothetical protein
MTSRCLRRVDAGSRETIAQARADAVELALWATAALLVTSVGARGFEPPTSCSENPRAKSQRVAAARN